MKYLVHFFLSLLYTDERHLGWDPTMRIFRKADNDDIRYIISVQTRTLTDPTSVCTDYYRTGRIVSDYGTIKLRGRGTRVWEVTQCTKEGEPLPGDPTTMILKDYWVDADRDREGDIHRQILDDAKQMGKHDEVKAIILTVQAHGVVYVDENKPDETSRRDHLSIPPKDQWFDLMQVSEEHLQRVEAMRQRNQSERSDPRDILFWTPYSPTLSGSKVHYRIVFKEACTALQNIDFLDRVLMVLSEACNGVSSPFLRLTLFLIFDPALKILHAIGWLHRDVSIGNILIKPNGSVVLADLEYAKRFDDPALRNDSTVSIVHIFATDSIIYF